MINNKISSRYARSLFDLAEDRNMLETIYLDAATVISMLDMSKELRNLLVNPIIKSGVKLNILSEILSGKVSSDMLNFVRFIIGKNREEYLGDIMHKFIGLRNDKLGIVDVVVKTAVVFSEEQTVLLNKKLESILNKKVQLSFVMDKNILGGFIARVEDTLYDASIRNQLLNLKKQLMLGSTL